MNDSTTRISPRGLSRAERVLQTRDFRRIYRHGSRARSAALTACVLANRLGWSRLGLSVSSRIGNAVVRNRWKRLLREAFRDAKLRLPLGWDIVFIPERPGLPPPLEVLRGEVPRLAVQAMKARSRRAAGRRRSSPRRARAAGQGTKDGSS